ncbi:MAG: hypothetical protein ACRC1J_04585, partial [Sandaracinobacteroides sp.]
SKEQLMRALLSDPHAQLLRLLRSKVASVPWFAGATAEDGLPGLVLENIEAEPWASLTFSGMRHTLEMRLDGEIEAVEGLFRDLVRWAGEPEYGLPGHFFAELQIAETSRELRESGYMSLGLRLEALTIEE